MDAQAPSPQNGSAQPTHETLRAEYSVLAESWRFLTGVRFILLAFAASFESGLMAGYQFLLTNIEKFGMFGTLGLSLVPSLGYLFTIAIILIEERTRMLYAGCLRRGLALERLLHIPDGHFHALWNAPLPFRYLSHTLAIRVIYALISATWLGLLLFALHRSLKGGS